MNIEHLTIKAQEALQRAQEVASEMQHAEIENTHLLKGLFLVDEHVL
jgi:ATP-dependent Clp protease ATP-binding subunit ClpB